MQGTNRRAVALLLAVLLLLLTGCGALQERLDDADATSNAMLASMLTALADRDANAAYALLLNKPDRDAFERDFLALASYWGDAREYSYKTQQINSRVSNGEKSFACVYAVTQADGTAFLASLSRAELADGRQGLVGFQLTLASEYAAATTPTGTLRTIGQFNAAQVALLIWSALCFAASVLAFIHCIRHAKRAKWLWLILIALLYGGVQLTRDAAHMNLMLRVATVRLSQLLLYPSGGSVLAIYLPLGALIYWLSRKKIGTPKPPKGSEAEQDQTPADDGPHALSTDAETQEPRTHAAPSAANATGTDCDGDASAADGVHRI